MKIVSSMVKKSKRIMENYGNNKRGEREMNEVWVWYNAVSILYWRRRIGYDALSMRDCWRETRRLCHGL